MQDFNNSNKDPVDFLKLSDLCLDICNDKAVKVGEWSDRDIDLFVAQFKEADLEPEVDMSMLDPKAYPRSYFEKKFPGFDDNVIDVLYELSNKSLEDTRLCPLRVMRGKTGSLAIENPNKIYNAEENHKTEGQEETEGTTETKGKEDCAAEAETSSEADDICCGTDRYRFFKTSQEEEDDEA